MTFWAQFLPTGMHEEPYKTEEMTVEEVKVLIWRYFISYWNNRRICSANGGLPPVVKRKQYYDTLDKVA